jgi:hypothetical protein
VVHRRVVLGECELNLGKDFWRQCLALSLEIRCVPYSLVTPMLISFVLFGNDIVVTIVFTLDVA